MIVNPVNAVTEKASAALTYLRDMHGEDAVTGLKAELGINDEWDDLTF